MKKINQNYQKIWDTVNVIPKGKVASYGQIADLAGLPGRARLTGKALTKTPENLKLPWHRVLRSNGQIAFPINSEKAHQQKICLMNEGVEVINLRVKLKDYGWKPSLEELLFNLKY